MILLAVASPLGLGGWGARAAEIAEAPKPAKSHQLKQALGRGQRHAINRDVKSGNSYAPIVKKAAPSVVYIFTTKTVKHPFEMPKLSGRRSPAPLLWRAVRQSGTRDGREFKERAWARAVIAPKTGFL